MNLKTLAVPVTLLMFRSIDQNDPSVQDNVSIAFGVAVTFVIAAYLYLSKKIADKNDETPITYQEPKQPMQQTEGETITTTHRGYDERELKELFGKQAILGLVVALAARYYWAALLPMVIQSISIPMNIYGHNLVKVYVFGEEAKHDLARPWKKPNPFGDMLGGAFGGGGEEESKDKKKKQ